jgi:quinolinate synthase
MSSASSQLTIAAPTDRGDDGAAPAPDRMLPLLVLGRQADPDSERGVSCTGELPAPSDPALVTRAEQARAALGERAFVLGHHYQRDEVIRFADVTGDSFKLAKDAAAKPAADFVIFCGVHFMAESADILTSDSQKVILPDLAAGCSMADMATYNQVEECWETLEDLGIATSVVPVTYMNSSADIKAFTGRHGGSVCTSSNAKRALTWALGERGAGGGGADKVLFLPDQHLGRNTAVLELGLRLDDCVVWDPRKAGGGVEPEALKRATMILWKGHCSVHGRFRPANVADVRNRVPGVNVIVHPECVHDVVLAADHVGSTEKIISTVEAAPAGSAWAVGTELNLVQRLAQNNPDKTVVFLDKTVCYCSTMNRIDLPHLVWAMESLADGHVVNQITVDQRTAEQARAALDQMLALP